MKVFVCTSLEDWGEGAEVANVATFANLDDAKVYARQLVELAANEHNAKFAERYDDENGLYLSTEDGEMKIAVTTTELHGDE